jgi:hypothetical protein
VPVVSKPLESGLPLLAADPEHWPGVESKMVGLLDDASLAIADAGEIILVS